MSKPEICDKCKTPTSEGCKHYRYSRGEPSLEILPIEMCDGAHLEKATGSIYPYCNEHGAMLAMERNCEIWRCISCGLGVTWNRRKYNMGREVCGAMITIDGGFENEELTLETATQIGNIIRKLTNWDVKVEEWFTGRGIEDEGYGEFDCGACNSNFIARPETIKKMTTEDKYVTCPNCSDIIMVD